MPAITLTLDVPDTRSVDLESLKKQMQAILNAIVTMPCVIKDKVYDIHMFDCLSEDWGGEGDANEIAEELRSSRKSDWNVESWGKTRK